ncbi:N-acyl homoserine lactonase family protein [Desulfurispora thermophila]|uniref:N-acyl homoserine lactonase family protein n=1 Tax=Desulfurispora thermophila TaxID=265470 RepID=UPI000360905A|nr:N-acyl homoserine lactonase family protein [Desulfurispora thermophila]
MYRIIPLQVAEIMAPLGVVAMFGDMQKLLVAPVFVFYLEGGDKKILVDAGVNAPDSSGTVHGFPIMGGGEQGLRQALAQVGVQPEEVDFLILTHLHFDHCAMLPLFRRARIVVQEKEWRTAHNPVPIARAVYERELFATLERMNLVLVNGDCEIAPGVKVLLLPGHTQGMQGVAVDTGQGRFVLAGDLLYSYYNLDPSLSSFKDLRGNEIAVLPRPDLPFLPPAVHIDLSDWYASCWKAVAQAGGRERVIPGHDPAVAGKVFGE